MRLLLTILLAIFPASVLSAAPPDSDLWYVIDMDGQRSGYMHTVQKTDGDRITSTTDTRFKIKRGATVMSLRFSTEFVETIDGKPVSMKSVQAFGTKPTTTTWTYNADDLTVVTTIPGGKPTTTTVPLPDGIWLTPAAAAEFTAKRLEAGAETIELRTIDPSTGPEPFILTAKVLERTTVEALGKTVPAIKLSQTISTVPNIATTAFVDERGVAVRSTTDIGGITMTILAADKDLALAKLDPPELMQRTFVKPDRPIEKPRSIRNARFVLSIPEGEFPALPDTGAQKVEPIDARSARVSVSTSGPGTPADPVDSANAAYTTASSALDSNDPEVIRLKDEALAKAAPGDALARATTLRDFVHTYISKKDLGVGFASASEVARSKQGDCSEHGCLLAAMLRADGIPARVASGLIYADAFAGSKAIFGYHMWAQALIEVDGKPTWVDLDATLPPSFHFDATHITLSVSPLADTGGMNPLVALAPLLGRLEVKVEQANP
ncbi:MAG: transglutaminase domain-containing protein [Phycisphaeraceae bacterium]|nr:transglutaminase domain-containing protein [Phycisphaeraceae bacterium]